MCSRPVGRIPLTTRFFFPSVLVATLAPKLRNRHFERSEKSLFSSLGAVANLGDESSPAEHALFNERGARCVLSVAPAKLAAVLAIARQYDVAARELGQVTRDGSFRIEHKGRAVIDSPVEALRDAWAHSLERTLALG